MDAAENSNTHPFLIYGTLLGKIRNNNLICHDYDVDFGIKGDEYNSFKESIKREVQKNNGYKIYCNEFFGYKAIHIIHKKTNISADITPFYENKNNNVTRNVPRFYSKFILKESNTIYPNNWIYPLNKTLFLNRLTYIPNNSHELLKCYYGENYLIPDQKCDDNCENCKKISIVNVNK